MLITNDLGLVRTSHQQPRRVPYISIGGRSIVDTLEVADTGQPIVQGVARDLSVQSGGGAAGGADLISRKRLAAPHPTLFQRERAYFLRGTIQTTAFDRIEKVRRSFPQCMQKELRHEPGTTNDQYGR
jgi:hypothetical protein